MTDRLIQDRWQRTTACLVLGVVALALVALCARVAYIGTQMAPRLTAIAGKQQHGQRTIPARRGLIFDRRGRIAAGSQLVDSVYVDPSLLLAAAEEEGTDVADICATLADRLDLDPDGLAQQIRARAARRFYWIKRHVSVAEADAIRRTGIAGVGLRQEMRRTYPLGNRLAHVLGVVGIDGNGLDGLEMRFDAHLRGRPGLYTALYDARRRAIAGESLNTVEPINGGHLMLTIDAVIQEAAEMQLARQIDEFKAESGVAVVMEPVSGEILAMACWPTFDPNEPAASPIEARRNRAITDPVEPGSTFKPIIAGAALEHGVISLTDRIDCHRGEHTINGRLLTDTHACGLATVKEILVHSSNIGMAQIGLRLGNTRLHETVRRFGFGSVSDVELPGEEPGTVLPRARWNSYSTTSIPMGYEIAVTPLQLATAYCAIVNGGVLLRPKVVKAVLTSDGELADAYEKPAVVRRVLPADVARFLTEEVLVEVVNRGGTRGHPLDLIEYQLLGKTGTTKLPFQDRPGYEPGAYLSSFVGAAPADDPRAVALVMIRKPGTGVYYGRQVAAPAVKEILFATLSYLGIPGRGTIQAGL
jgi:cell division protein FtsI (penicillin-binding protein 3)